MMGSLKSVSALSARVFIGVCLLASTWCGVCIWGNVAVYVISYFHFRLNSDVGNMSSIVLSFNIVAWSIGMTICEKTARIVGVRRLLAATILLYSGGAFLTYLTVQHSFVAFSLTFGLVCGVGYGIAQAIQIMTIPMWVDHRWLGIACCIALAGVNIGSLFIDLVFTWYINPSNLVPDTQVMNQRLFSQPEVLDKVPSAFILYGCIALGLSAISFAMIRLKDPSGVAAEQGDELIRMTSDGVNSYNAMDNSSSSSSSSSGGVGTGTASLELVDEQSVVQTMGRDERIVSIPTTDQTNYSETIRKSSPPTQIPHHGSSDSAEVRETTRQTLDNESLFPPETKTAEHKAIEASETTTTTTGSKKLNPCNDVTPRQAVKTSHFYALFIFVFCVDSSMIVTFTFCKDYGMSRYPDDHFFTSMSVTMCFVNFVIISLAGLASDTFGVKNTILASSVLMCVAGCFFYVSAYAGKWIYFVCANLYSGSSTSSYILVSVCCLYYFGNSYATTVNGMIMCSAYLSNIIMPIVIPFIMSNYGWFTLFTTLSGLSTISVLAIVFGLPAVSPITHNSNNSNKNSNNSDNNSKDSHSFGREPN